MGSLRQFPLDEPAARPLAHRPAPASADAVSARWPILARIAEIGRSDEPGATSDPPPSSQVTYRLDAPHAATPGPLHDAASETSPLPQPTTSHASTRITPPPAAPLAASQSRTLQSAPLPIRVAVEAWQIILPHRELIRFAAILALMAAGGMSAALMMGDRFQIADKPVQPVTTTARQTKGPEPTTQHAELEPTLDPVVAPDNDTSSIEPTATGPLTPASRPLMAIESKEPPAASPYPVTAFAETTLPPFDDSTLPQVKTTEPEAVARLRGDLINTKIR